MDFLGSLATIVFILIFLLLIAHPRISLEPYVDVLLWAGIMSGYAVLINGTGTYAINVIILFRCIVAVLAIIFFWRLFKREVLGGKHMLKRRKPDV